MLWIATELAMRNVAAKVDFGFIKGRPSIAEAMHALALRDAIWRSTRYSYLIATAIEGFSQRFPPADSPSALQH